MKWFRYNLDRGNYNNASQGLMYKLMGQMGLPGELNTDELVEPTFRKLQRIPYIKTGDFNKTFSNTLYDTLSKQIESKIISQRFNSISLAGRMNLPREQVDNYLREYVEHHQQFSDALQLKNPDELNKSIKELTAAIKAAETEKKAAQSKAGGGFVFANGGSVFKPRGTDTVPAMLTPGEFVVRASEAAKHKKLLEQINRGHFGTAAQNRLYRDAYTLSDSGEVFDRPADRMKFVQGLPERTRSVLGAHYQQLEDLKYKVSALPVEQMRRLYMTQVAPLARYQLRLVNRRMRALRNASHYDLNDAVKYNYLEQTQEFLSSFPTSARQINHMGKLGMYNLLEGAINGNPNIPSPVALAPRLPSFEPRRYRPQETLITPDRPPAHFATGGFVGSDSHDYGYADSRPYPAFHQSASSLSQSFVGFNGTANALIKAMEAMPNRVTHEGQHTLVHHFHGLEFLNHAEPAFRDIAERLIGEKLSKLVRDHFPSLPPM